MWGGRFEASVIRYPTGRYGICGNVPESLTEFRDGLYPCRASKVWNTEQEALEALRKAEAE
jgi:hypothetical protein